jgi:hypothetical protein
MSPLCPHCAEVLSIKPCPISTSVLDVCSGGQEAVYRAPRMVREPARRADESVRSTDQGIDFRRGETFDRETNGCRCNRQPPIIQN